MVPPSFLNLLQKIDLPIDPLLSQKVTHKVIVRLSKKKAMGSTHGLKITAQGPWTALMACPWPLFSSSRVLTEEGRFICKAKKTKIEGTNLLSSSDHDFPYYFFLEKSQ